MPASLPDIVSDSKALNSKVFSLPRLLILSSLDELPERESAQYRELKGALGLGDGVLFANLKALLQMGYIQEGEAKVEERNMTVYSIAKEGKEELKRLREWFLKWINLGGENEGHK
ncbi:hypothetical protein AUJ17_02395 [Candidatus Micrarchaeota archaeon CG1_02_47_40]|nr:MAG: hypothetical protein AUJ17_02395 [Candidatus Micrarchaeota archaeon CG1_02_47_40]